MTAHRADRRDLILESVEDFILEYGHPPSVRDLLPMVSLASTGALSYHLRILERQGALRRCGCGCDRFWPSTARLRDIVSRIDTIAGEAA